MLSHIRAGRGMQIYNSLGLRSVGAVALQCKNVKSNKMGKKDIHQDFRRILMNFDVLGYIDQKFTAYVFIENGDVKIQA